MKKYPSYQSQKFTIPAGGAIDWNRYGSSFGCLDASGTFFVKFDGQPRTQFEKGLSIDVPETFNQVRIENRGETEITLTVFAADGELRDARLTLPTDLVAFPGAARRMRTSSTEVSSGVRKSIAPADTGRIEILITNMGTEPVFLGDDGVLWAQGLPLAQGSTATLKVQTEIFAYAQADGIQTLAIMETMK